MIADTGKTGFFEELIRRRVIKVLLIYGGAAWAVSELITAMADAWGLPQQITRITLISFIAGFPLVAVLTWLYDIRDRRVHLVASSDWRFAVFSTFVISLTLLGLWLVLRATPDITVDLTPGAGRLPEIPDTTTSVAVLPFVNMSGDEGNEYFSDGISEELLNSLARIPGLRVPSRTSSFTFKGLGTDIREIAGQLQVGMILEGSVRRSDNRVRITAQLIDVADDRHIWSETYDRELTDIFAIQTDIANQIAGRLSVSLADVLPTAPGQATNLDAYDAYLKGRHYLRKRSAEASAEAVRLLEEAVRIDSGFAAGYAALATANLLRFVALDSGWETYWSNARSSAEKALELDPDQPVALSTLGKILEYELRWAESRLMYERAIAVQPNDSTTRHWYATHMQRAGQQDDALPEALLAADLDPQNEAVIVTLVFNYYLTGEKERARELLERKTDEGVISPWYDAAISLRMLDLYERGMFEEIRQLYRDLIAALGMPVDSFEPVMLNIGAESQTHETATVLEVAETMPGIDPISIAFLHVMTGEAGKGIETMLNSDARDRVWFSGRVWFAAMQSVRQHPRFPEFISEVGLADYWRDYGAPGQCRPAGESFACN